MPKPKPRWSSLELSDEEDFIDVEEEPPKKRLKGANSKPVNVPSRRKNSRTIHEDSEDEPLILDSEEEKAPKPKRTPKKRQPKKTSTKKSGKAQVPVDTVKDSENDNKNIMDFDDVVWEDVGADKAETGDEDQRLRDSTQSALGPTNGGSSTKNPKNTHEELDIHLEMEKEEEEPVKNEKKRPRQSKPRLERRGSKIERSHAINWHNMHLATWIGHCIYLKTKLEDFHLNQAILVSLLPLELFLNCTKLSSDDSFPKSEKEWKSIVRDLIKWFHEKFEVWEPYIPQHMPPQASGKTSEDAIDLNSDTDSKPSKSKSDPSHGSNPKTITFTPKNVKRIFAPFSWFLKDEQQEKIRITAHVAFQTFGCLLEGLGIPIRHVWAFDKTIVPSKFSDFIKIVPRIRYSNAKFAEHLATAFCLLSAAPKQVQIKKPESTNKKKKSKVKMEVDEEEAGGEQNSMWDLPPVMWFEIFDFAKDRWVHLDIFRQIIDKPEKWNTKLSEMDAKSPKKGRSAKKTDEDMAGYLVSVGAHGKLFSSSARYCKSYSEPLRKVADIEWFESLIEGWNRLNASKIDASENILLDRLDTAHQHEIDQIIEDEPFPKTQEAYRQHPLYCLERFFLKFEMLRPDHSPPVHTVGADQAPVYLRKDLCQLHTQEKWIQEGMQVKKGEKPATEMKKRTWTNWVLADDEAEMSPYFGSWQVEPYVPPVAVNGIVPKNQFGNVYLFKPEMLPVGTVHILGYPNLNRACKKIGVDCAAAMIGWTQQGGWAQPDLGGWVLCEGKVEVAIEAWHAENERRIEAEKKVKERAKKNWLDMTKHLLLKARLDQVHQLVAAQGNNNSGEHTTVNNINDRMQVDPEVLVVQPSLLLLPSLLQSGKKSSLKVKKAAAHTHTFPPELSTQNEKGEVVRKCPCGYTDSVMRL